MLSSSCEDVGTVAWVVVAIVRSATQPAGAMQNEVVDELVAQIQLVAHACCLLALGRPDTLARGACVEAPRCRDACLRGGVMMGDG